MTTTPTDTRALDELSVNAIRTLSMDAVQAANSGHPGAPMALAPLAYVLYTRVMRHNPRNPDWFDRDRFILSAGHASMLLYSTLYLSGYGLELDDLKNFRQLGSRTPGHPERQEAPGVEITTVPLGQGRGGPSLAGDPADPYRHGQSEQAGHERRARQRARRGGGRADEEGVRLAVARAVLRPRGGRHALPPGDARARRPGRGGVGRARPDLRGRPPRPLAPAQADHGRPPAGRLGRRHAPDRPLGGRDRHPQGRPAGARLGGLEDPAPDRGRCRPLIVDADHHHGRRQYRPAQHRWTQRLLRRPRARHGRDRERSRGPRIPGARRDLPPVLRLHEEHAPAGGHHGGAIAVRLHPRLDRAG